MVDKATDKLFGNPELLICGAVGEMKPIGKIVDCSTSLESEEESDCVPTKARSHVTPHMQYPKRRANLLYKLRRKGIVADTKQCVIFIPYGEEPSKHIQVVRLCREFYFNIQFIIT